MCVPLHAQICVYCERIRAWEGVNVNSKLRTVTFMCVCVCVQHLSPCVVRQDAGEVVISQAQHTQRNAEVEG